MVPSLDAADPFVHYHQGPQDRSTGPVKDVAAPRDCRICGTVSLRADDLRAQGISVTSCLYRSMHALDEPQPGMGSSGQPLA